MSITAHIGGWRDEVIENPEGFLFTITCQKCKSQNIALTGIDDLRMGSEYTGMYGEADAVIKCVDCGNAFSWRIADR